MNRKLLNGLLVIAFAAGGVVTFTSCKDEDFRNGILVDQVNLEKQIQALRDLTDQEFRTKLAEFIDEQMADLAGDVADLEERVETLEQIWQWIQDGDEKANPYVQAIYDMMFNNIFPEEDWFRQIWENEMNIDNILVRPSSVEVSHVYNTVFGTFNLPAGVNSTVFATYKYKPASDQVNFPGGLTAGNFSYGYNMAAIDAVKALSPEGAENFNSVAFSDAVEFGNMGGAVVTINPANIDGTKYDVNLVNSLGTAVWKGGKALKAWDSDKELTFGASRAAVEGVYELDVDVTEANADALMVDFSEAKSGVKNAFETWFNDKKNLYNIAGLGKVLVDAVNNKVPAYALQLAWEEQTPVLDEAGEKTYDENGVIITKPVTNTYQTGFDYAAVVARPLSYGDAKTLSDYIKQHNPSNRQLPTFNSPLADYLSEIGQKLDMDFPRTPELGTLSVYVKVVEQNGKLVVAFWREYNAETGEFSDPIGMGEYQYDPSTGLNLSAEELQELAQALVSNYNNVVVNQDVIDSINEAIRSINTALDDVEMSASDLKSYIDRLLGSKKLEYAQKVVNWYNRFANKVNNFIADPERYFQVLALYDGKNGVGRLSTVAGDPTRFNIANSSFNVYLTSYTGEIVIPSYKKYVAITAATGKTADQLKTINAAGEGLNQVLAGYENVAKVNLNASDFNNNDVLTITYISLDYHGVCSMQNYYVRIMK